MSSISAQGVVERASAELSKRINGLGLRSKHHHGSGSSSGSGKTSVMERVTNALCGGSSSNSNNSNTITNTPEKPSRIPNTANTPTPGSLPTTPTTNNLLTNNLNSINTMNPSQMQNSSSTTSPSMANSSLMMSGGGSCKSMNVGIPLSASQQHQQQMGLMVSNKNQGGTPIQIRKQLPNPHLHHNPYVSGGVVNVTNVATALQLHKVASSPPIVTIDQLMMDERFINKLINYFTPYERRTLAQVCTKWRDILYRSPRYWAGLLPTLQCRELRQVPNQDRVRLFNSLMRRGFHSLALVGATDEDALDVVHSFPLASKHINSLSLRCSSISDRGLEALLDHLQVS